MELDTITCAEATAYLAGLPDESVHCIVTSPPYYGLRDYGTGVWVGGSPTCEHIIGYQVQDSKWAGAITRGVRPGSGSVCRLCGANYEHNQIGLEETPQEYIGSLVAVFREMRRVLRRDGTAWVVMGDSYVGSTSQHKDGGSQGHNSIVSPGTMSSIPTSGRKQRVKNAVASGFKPKDLMLMPARLAIALCDDGWYLRQEIVWAKNNPMPESVRDRPTRSHETVYLLGSDEDSAEIMYLLSKRAKYVTDMAAIRENSTSDHASGNGYRRDERLSYSDDGGARGSDQPWEVQPTRNARSVWTIPSAQANYCYCRNCDSLFVGPDRNRVNKGDDGKVCPTCQRTDGWVAHYAAFPPALVQRAILAGCPARVCDKCGAPWQRTHKRTGHINVREEAHAPNSGPTKVDSTGWKPQSVPTVEFAPTCNCGSENFETGTVLDPFMGSGTTALTAYRLGRHYLGCDLSQDYVRLARARLQHAAIPPAVVKEDGVQPGLFETQASLVSDQGQ